MIRKIICIGVLLIMAFSFGAGCGPEWALESGFDDKWTNGNPPKSPYQCAYRSDKTEFDLDDVTLTFFYGNIRVTAGTSYAGNNFYSFNREELIEKTSHIEVYWSQSGEDTIIKTISPEEFFSDEYARKGEGREGMYNHSEVLTIPRELFEIPKKAGYEGVIWFGIQEVYKEELHLTTAFLFLNLPQIIAKQAK